MAGVTKTELARDERYKHCGGSSGAPLGFMLQDGVEFERE